MNIKIDNEEVHSPKEGQAVRGVQAPEEERVPQTAAVGLRMKCPGNGEEPTVPVKRKCQPAGWVMQGFAGSPFRAGVSWCTVGPLGECDYGIGTCGKPEFKAHWRHIFHIAKGVFR